MRIKSQLFYIFTRSNSFIKLIIHNAITHGSVIIKSNRQRRTGIIYATFSVTNQIQSAMLYL